VPVLKDTRGGGDSIVPVGGEKEKGEKGDEGVAHSSNTKRRRKLYSREGRAGD